jgi:hypothetical protein
MLGDNFANAANDFGFRLADGPGCLFPLAHLRNTDDR